MGRPRTVDLNPFARGLALIGDTECLIASAAVNGQSISWPLPVFARIVYQAVPQLGTSLEAQGNGKLTVDLIHNTIKQLLIGQGQDSKDTTLGTISRARVKFDAVNGKQQALEYHEYVMEFEQLLRAQDEASEAAQQGDKQAGGEAGEGAPRHSVAVAVTSMSQTSSWDISIKLHGQVSPASLQEFLVCLAQQHLAAPAAAAGPVDSVRSRRGRQRELHSSSPSPQPHVPHPSTGSVKRKELSSSSSGRGARFGAVAGSEHGAALSSRKRAKLGVQRRRDTADGEGAAHEDVPTTTPTAPVAAPRAAPPASAPVSRPTNDPPRKSHRAEAPSRQQQPQERLGVLNPGQLQQPSSPSKATGGRVLWDDPAASDWEGGIGGEEGRGDDCLPSAAAAGGGAQDAPGVYDRKHSMSSLGSSRQQRERPSGPTGWPPRPGGARTGGTPPAADQSQHDFGGGTSHENHDGAADTLREEDMQGSPDSFAERSGYIASMKLRKKQEYLPQATAAAYWAQQRAWRFQMKIYAGDEDGDDGDGDDLEEEEEAHERAEFTDDPRSRYYDPDQSEPSPIPPKQWRGSSSGRRLSQYPSKADYEHELPSRRSDKQDWDDPGGLASDDFESEDQRALRGHVNYSSGPSMPGPQNINYHPEAHYQQHGRSDPSRQAYSGPEADMDGAGQQDWGDACYEDEGDERDGWNTGTGSHARAGSGSGRRLNLDDATVAAAVQRYLDEASATGRGKPMAPPVGGQQQAPGHALGGALPGQRRGKTPSGWESLEALTHLQLSAQGGPDLPRRDLGDRSTSKDTLARARRGPTSYSSVHDVDEGFDSGPSYARKRFPSVPEALDRRIPYTAPFKPSAGLPGRYNCRPPHSSYQSQGQRGHDQHQQRLVPRGRLAASADQPLRQAAQQRAQEDVPYDPERDFSDGQHSDRGRQRSKEGQGQHGSALQGGRRMHDRGGDSVAGVNSSSSNSRGYDTEAGGRRDLPRAMLGTVGGPGCEPGSRKHPTEADAVGYGGAGDGGEDCPPIRRSLGTGLPAGRGPNHSSRDRGAAPRSRQQLWDGQGPRGAPSRPDGSGHPDLGRPPAGPRSMGGAAGGSSGWSKVSDDSAPGQRPEGRGYQGPHADSIGQSHGSRYGRRQQQQQQQQGSGRSHGGRGTSGGYFGPPGLHGSRDSAPRDTGGGGGEGEQQREFDERRYFTYGEEVEAVWVREAQHTNPEAPATGREYLVRPVSYITKGGEGVLVKGVVLCHRLQGTEGTAVEGAAADTTAASSGGQGLSVPAVPGSSSAKQAGDVSSSGAAPQQQRQQQQGSADGRFLQVLQPGAIIAMKVALHFADLPLSSQRQFYHQRAEESEDSEQSEEPMSPEECYVQEAARSLAQEHALMVECAPHTERTLRSHVYGRVRTREGYDAPCLLVDYAAGGSLGELLRALKGWYGQGLLEEDTRRVIRLIAEAILALHRHAGALHRDLKPDNILLMQPWPPLVAGRLEYRQLPGLLDSVVLADYGLARRLRSGELAMTQAFSVDFEVPEVMAGGLYDWRVDAFLLGLMVPACAFGDVPLPDNRWQTPEARARVIGYEQLRQQVQNKPRFSWMTTGHCGSFLRCTLNTDVSRRDSVVTLFEAGNVHPYLKP